MKHGVLGKTAEKYRVSIRTCQRILHRFLETGIKNMYRCNCGKKKIPFDVFQERMSNVPFNKRTNIRALACAMNLPRSTVHRRVKEGLIKVEASRIKPQLTPQHRLDRISFVLKHIDHDGMMNNFEQYIHVDEKWFYMTKKNQRYYLLPDNKEEVPHRTCIHKSHITKVMFLAAVARPRYCPHVNQAFDGLIGIWPFVTCEEAKRDSKNRKKGTLVTKPVTSVTADAYANMFVENVLPAIKKRWPSSNKEQIIIQEDNCRVHTRANRILIESKGKEDHGLDISVRPQPARSPDFNVLDLGFFNSIQSLKDQYAPRTVDELISAVESAFWNQPQNTVDNVFLSLQGAMIDSLTVDGNNNYKIRHLKKEKLRRRGLLPKSLKCDPLLIARGREVLDEPSCLDVDALPAPRFHAVGVGPHGRKKFEGDGVIFGVEEV